MGFHSKRNYLERFFSRMLTDVCPQDARSSEGLAAVDALVRSLAAVNLHQTTSKQFTMRIGQAASKSRAAIVVGVNERPPTSTHTPQKLLELATSK